MLKRGLVKGAPAFYSMHQSFMVIFLFTTNLFKSAFFTYTFKKLVFFFSFSVLHFFVYLLCFEFSVTFRFCICSFVYIGTKWSLISFSLYMNHKHSYTCDHNINYLQKHKNRVIKTYFQRGLEILKNFHLEREIRSIKK